MFYFDEICLKEASKPVFDLLDKGATDKAISTAKSAISGKSGANLAFAQVTLARALLYKDNILDAEKAATEAISAFEKLKDEDGTAAAKNALAKVNCAKNATLEAAKIANEALSLYKKNKSLHGEASVYQTLVSVNLADQRLREASKMANQIVSIWKSETDLAKQRVCEGVGMLTICEVNMATGDYDKAKEVAEKASVQFKSAKDESRAAKALIKLAEASVAGGDYDEAMSASAAAMNLSKTYGDEYGEALAMLTRSTCCSDEHEAIYCAEHAAQLFSKLGDQSNEAKARNSMATIHIQKMNELIAIGEEPWYAIDSAQRSAKEAVTLFREVGDEAGEASASYSLASALLSKGDISEALRAAKLTLSLNQRIKDVKGEAWALLLLAQAQVAKGAKEEAIHLTGKAKSLFADLDDEEGESAAIDLRQHLKGVDKSKATAQSGDLIQHTEQSSDNVYFYSQKEAIQPNTDLTDYKFFVHGDTGIPHQIVNFDTFRTRVIKSQPGVAPPPRQDMPQLPGFGPKAEPSNAGYNIRWCKV